MGQNEVRYLKKIGKGSYGEVYKAKWKGRLVAVKRLHPNLLRYDPGGENGLVAQFLRECCLLQDLLKHPNIVELLHIVNEEGKSPILITELLDCDLAALVKNSKSDPKVATEDVLNIFLGIAKGLECLHGHGVIHRDLAPKNILIDGMNHAKIADVGLAKLAADLNTPVPGTPFYMAPETYPTNGSRRVRYGIESDIYSFGVMLLEIIVGHPPQTMENPLSHDQASTQRCRHKKGLDELRDHPFRELVIRCLEENPEDRPTSTEIIAQLENPDFRKEIARFDLSRSVTKLQEELLRWTPIRRQTVRELEELSLKDIADRLDEHHHNVNIATAAGATTSILATGVAVSGFISSFFTFGATIPVAIAGAVIGAAGGLTTFGSKMTEIVLSKLASAKVSDTLEEDQAACTDIRKRMSQLDELITRNVLKIVDNLEGRRDAEQHKIEDVVKLFEDMTGMAKPKPKQFDPIERSTRGISAVLGAATSCTTAGIAGARAGTAVAFDSLSAAARATHIAGFVVSILALPFDVYFLAKSSKELIDGSPSKAAEKLRSIEERLVCPEEEEVSDLVHAYVEEKVAEVARKLVIENDIIASEWDIIDEPLH